MVQGFEISKHTKLVPCFSEKEVEDFFPAFESIATRMGWPLEYWKLPLQAKIVGKAMTAFNAIKEDKSNYELVCKEIHKTYSLVPEAYR